LGHRDGRFFFFDPAGQLRALAARNLGQPSEIAGLFCGDTDWLVGNYPQLNKEGDPTGSFSVRSAGEALMRSCFVAGLFRLDEPQRGVGVWWAGDRVAVHLGDRVFWPDNGEFQPAGFRAFGALWPVHPAVPAPTKPCGPEVVERVQTVFGKWYWKQTSALSGWSGAAVILGLWAAGLLGAVTGWRPHGLVVGAPGTGKTSLFQFYRALSPLAEEFNDFSEAGLRQAMTGRAAPMILDEADEGPESGGRLQGVIGLMRRASGLQGARVVRGSVGGQAQHFEVVSQAIMGCVLPPPLQPQDATRISRVDLLPRPQGGEGTLPDRAEIQWAKDVAPALWARALVGLPRFRANLDQVRAVLLDRGCAPRLADQVGTILAARGMMLLDDPMGGSDIEEAILAAGWLVQTEELQSRESGGPYACLEHLLSSASGIVEGGGPLTIGTLVARAASMDEGDVDSGHANRQLGELGLRVRRFPKLGAGLYLFVSNRHAILASKFAGTGWQRGQWTEDLRRLPGAEVPMDPVPLRATTARGVAIPNSLWASRPAVGDGHA